MTAVATLRGTSTVRGPTLDFASLMSADVGSVVLKHLASTQDRARICRIVSKECRQLVDGQVHSLRANLKALSARDEAASLPLRFPCLERLSFDLTSASDSSRLLQHLAAQQPQLLVHLQELDLSSCQGLEADALRALMQAAPRLQTLVLPTRSSCVASSKTDYMRVISSLGAQLLCLRGVGDYMDDDSISLLGSLTHLQVLDLSTERYALPVAPRSLSVLSGLSDLHSLQLGNHLACHDVFELAAALPALQQLEFSYVREVTVSVQELAPLQHSKTLRRLVLSGMVCTDELLHVLAASPVAELALQACTFAASPKGAALLSGRLQALQLAVNDRSIPALAAALPVLGSGLTSLCLTLHRATADCTALLQAVFSLPVLQELSLGSNYNGITEEELQDLPLLAQLTRLSLCNHFTDATLCRLLRSTPGLRALTLSSCGEVGAVGLGCVLGHCRGLREVTLQLMRGATAAGVAALASGPCMSRIVVEGCRNVSAEECRELMHWLNRPELDIIKRR